MRNPTSWKKNEIATFIKNTQKDPVGRSSTIMSSPGWNPAGAWTVVSKYVGTESACASW